VHITYPYGKGSSHSLVRRYQHCGRSVLGLGLPFSKSVRSLAVFEPLFPRPSTPLFGQVRGSRFQGHSVFRMGLDPGIQYGTIPVRESWLWVVSQDGCTSFAA
jgi:hypothetical protein